MSCSPNQLSPINIACNGQFLPYNHCEDRFVPDVLKVRLSESPTQSYYPTNGKKRTRADSGIWSEDLDEGFLGSLCTASDSKRHCSPVNSVSGFPGSPLSLEDIGISIPVTSTGGSSPLGVDFLQPTSSSDCISHYSTSGSNNPSVFQQSFLNSGNIGGANIFSMQQCHETVVANQSTFSEEYRLVITEQPELYYRARYQTEGVRAPIKGRSDNYPSVQVIGPAQFNYGGKVVVKLVHADGSDHTSCSLDCSEERKNALVKKIGPHNHMATEFEDLRIRREKKKEGRKVATSDKLSQKEGHNDKVACLLFEAEIRTSDQGIIKCKVKSEPISLNAAPEPAELDWIQPERGHVNGREVVVIKGSKMTSPKVTFRVFMDGKYQDLHGAVDKDRSHQNVLLVRTPSLSQIHHHFGSQNIQAEVIVTTGRTQLASNHLRFEYIPDNVCRECMQDTSSLPQYPTGGSCGSPLPIGLYPPSSMQHEHPSPTHVPQSPAHEPTYKVTPPTAGASQASLPKDMCRPGDMMPPQTTSLIPQTFLDGSGSSDKQEDIMQFVHNLMGAEYTGDGSSSSAGMSNPGQQQNLSGSNYMMQSTSPFVSVENQLQASTPSYQLPESAVNSPLYLNDNPVNSPSADTPLYSPVTPIPDSPAGVWTLIEQMLHSLHQTCQISPEDYMLYKSHCNNQSPVLFDTYTTSHNNEEVFLNLLACIKSDLYPKTH